MPTGASKSLVSIGKRFSFQIGLLCLVFVLPFTLKRGSSNISLDIDYIFRQSLSHSKMWPLKSALSFACAISVVEQTKSLSSLGRKFLQDRSLEV